MSRTMVHVLILVICVALYVTKAYGQTEVDSRLKKVTHKARFVIHHGDTKLGVITVNLYGKIAPRTVKNFITFAGDGFWGLSYNSTEFHRVKESLIQGGDVENRKGWGSLSIYGTYFDDEPFLLNHAEPGIVSSANAGKDTNGAQFIITTEPAPWLDGQNLAFGNVSRASMTVIKKIQQVQVGPTKRPLTPVVITNCTVKVLEELRG
ncbi:uncharacterized protein LOC135377708 [Ornithodoros turicata]|uniref:uncharacterized protein LOC135377708 n=1 Tax=Ornithodoros turicata TaxID=34597 RepID=UPI00313A46C5